MSNSLLGKGCEPGPNALPDCPASNYRRVRNLIGLLTGLFLVLGISAIVGFQYRTERLVGDQIVAQARAHAREFEAMRLFVSSFGGVYVPASAEETANPHLVGALGDVASLVTPSGQALVLRNSPLVAASVSSYLQGLTSDEPITLRMASERPLNQANLTDDFERQALKRFRGDARLHETWNWQNEAGVRHFRYAIPISAKESCVACHPYLANEVGVPFAVLGVDMDVSSMADRLTVTRWWTLASALGFALAVLIGLKFIILTTLGGLRDSQDRMLELARTDGLTGLANSRTASARLAEELSRTEREGSGLAVALLDLDDFKLVNDRLGHVEGDRALRVVADELRDQTRDNETVARIGGEEFLVIMTSVDPEQALAGTERIRAAISHALQSAFPEIPSLGASAGVTLARGGDTAQQLVSRADSAMYQAKSAGKRRTSIVD